jgi:hypothetical protein
MTVQNRVAPDGSLHAVSMRGTLTGNRGVIHNPGDKTLSGRRWTTPAWICCALEWQGKKREVWGRNFIRPDGTSGTGWSELFFLDEVTALAAGHRPCHTCRPNAAMSFHRAFCEANADGSGQTGAAWKNCILHAQRWQSSRTAPILLQPREIAKLPDGAVIKADEHFMAVRKGKLLPWHFEGYGKAVPMPGLSEGLARLVTPTSIVAAIIAGYKPIWHPSAS